MMVTISSIQMIKEEKAYCWNIVFSLMNENMRYATDIIFAVRRNYWVANTFITHELSSLMEGAECSICQKNKIACLPLSTQHVEVMEGIIKHPSFQEQVCKVVGDLTMEDFPTELKIENNKEIWNEIVYENTTHKILKKQ